MDTSWTLCGAVTHLLRHDAAGEFANTEPATQTLDAWTRADFCLDDGDMCAAPEPAPLAVDLSAPTVNLTETIETPRQRYRQALESVVRQVPDATSESVQGILDSLGLGDSAAAAEAHDDCSCMASGRKRGRRKMTEEGLSRAQLEKRRRNNEASARFRARKRLRDSALESVARHLLERCLRLEAALADARGLPVERINGL